MTPDVREAPRRALLALAVGTALWLFLRLCAWALGRVPGFREASVRWEDTAALGVGPAAELGMAVALAAVLMLLHGMERTPHAKRAAGVGLLMAIAPAAALLGAGDRAGLLDIAAIRAGVTMAGVVIASVLLYRLGYAPTAQHPHRAGWT